MVEKFYSIHGALTGATTLCQSGTGSNGKGNESSGIGASLLDSLVSYLGHLLGDGVLPLCRDAIGVFHRPSQMG